MLGFGLAPRAAALSGAALAHGTAPLSSCPFTDAPPQPCTALPFLILAALTPLLLLFFAWSFPCGQLAALAASPPQALPLSS